MQNGVRDTAEQMKHNETDQSMASRYSSVGGNYASDIGGGAPVNINHTTCQLDTLGIKTGETKPVQFELDAKESTSLEGRLQKIEKELSAFRYELSQSTPTTLRNQIIALEDELIRISNYDKSRYIRALEDELRTYKSEINSFLKQGQEVLRQIQKRNETTNGCIKELEILVKRVENLESKQEKFAKVIATEQVENLEKKLKLSQSSLTRHVNKEIIQRNIPQS